MRVIRDGIATGRGPAEWFTGLVLIDTVAVPEGPSRLMASMVHFAPGARTAWHRHPNGQTILITESPRVSAWPSGGVARWR
jgi:quercetin dioxygenase-like cupin family protein